MPSRLDALDPSPYGINSHKGPRALLARLAAIGILWHRVDVGWDEIEPRPGEYRWDEMDQLLGTTGPELGLSLLAVVAYTPSWASTSGLRSKPPRDPGLFVSFVEAFLERYPGKIAALSLWNEPDLRQFWDGSPEEHRKLVIPALRLARQKDARLALCGPDLSGWTKDVRKRWLQPFLAEAHDADGPLLDVITHHQYGGGDTVAGRVKEIETLRGFLAGGPFSRHPLWLTETGWNDGPQGQVDSAQQAENLRGMMAAMRGRPWWSKTFWYDSHGKVDKKTAEWGVFTSDESEAPGREKPAFAAYAQVVAQRGAAGESR